VQNVKPDHDKMKVIQRSLPIDTTYSIVESFYKSLEDGGDICNNCGKLISNVAVIKNANGNTFNVGLDCASTLSGIKDDFSFEYIHKTRFAQAKQARAFLQKLLKKAQENNVHLIIKAKTFTNTENFYKEIGSGMMSTDCEPFNVHYRSWKQFPEETWNKYVLPMIKDLTTVNETES